jgi:selenocysteine-specific elongation factor
VHVRLLDDDGRYARLRFSDALPLAPGDRIVLRSPGRRATVAGAEVLDVAPARRRADAIERLGAPLPARVLDARPWLTDDDLAVLAGVGVDGARGLAAGLVEAGEAVRLGGWLVARRELERSLSVAREQVRRHHDARPTSRGLDLAALASALSLDVARARAVIGHADDLVVSRDVVRHRDHAGAATEHPDARRLIDALEASPFSPPSPAELGVPPALVRDLVREGAVVELDGVHFAPEAIERARRLVGGAVVERGALTVADVRDLLGSSRKYVLPIVHRLDAEGVTRRRGDDRVPGPRAADAAG